MQVWTGNGTWNRPSGVKYIHVRLNGGGGGGAGHGESGGAGGYAERVMSVANISSVGISIGGGGGGTWYFNRGGDGGSTSFGPYMSAGGGHGAARNNSHSGGLGRQGSGGDLNIWGGGGQSHAAHGGGTGGPSHFGGSVAAGWPNGGNFSTITKTTLHLVQAVLVVTSLLSVDLTASMVSLLSSTTSN